MKEREACEQIRRYASLKKRREFVGSYGSTQIIALSFGAVLGAQERKLITHFAPFRNDAVSEAFAHTNHRASQDSVVIQKLKAAVGAQLVERDTRNVALTPEGVMFVEVARALVSDIDVAFTNMTDYIALRKGRVSIAALPSLAANGLPAVIAEHRKQFPGITCSCSMHYPTSA